MNLPIESFDITLNGEKVAEHIARETPLFQAKFIGHFLANIGGTIDHEAFAKALDYDAMERLRKIMRYLE